MRQFQFKEWLGGLVPLVHEEPPTTRRQQRQTQCGSSSELEYGNEENMLIFRFYENGSG